MTLKHSRWNKIKSFLRLQSAPVSLTEIHEALVRRMHLEVSRKTIERDILEMQERGAVLAIQGVPSRFMLQKGAEIEITLNLDEINYLLGILNAEEELYLKLKRYVD
jgi:hypothetical protein